MTTEQYLNQIFMINKRIQDKLCEAEQWREIAESTSVNVNPDKVQTSSKKDKMGDAIVQAIEFEREANEMANELMILKHTIIKQIDEVTDTMQYTVLKDYYVNDMSIRQISQEVHHSVRQTYRVYEKALESFEKIHGKKYLKVGTR